MRHVSPDGMVELWQKASKLYVWPLKHIQESCMDLHIENVSISTLYNSSNDTIQPKKYCELTVSF